MQYPANPAKPSESSSPGIDRARKEGHFRYPAGNDLSIEPPGFFAEYLAGYWEALKLELTRRRVFAEYLKEKVDG